MANDRATREEYNERLKLVKTFLAKGMPLPQIRRLLAEEIGISQRQVDNYIKDVFNQWENKESKQRPGKRAQIRYQLYQLYEKCFEKKDYKTCVTILDRLCKLDALDLPTEDIININHQHTAILSMSAAERQERLYQLQGKLITKQLAAKGKE
jgi:DNA-binding transcriptional MerR regulator